MQNSIWEILAAKINGEELTSEEQVILKEWLEADAENRTTMRKIDEFYTTCREGTPVDVEAAYRICMRKITRRRKTYRVRRSIRWVYAASVVLLFSFSYYYFFYNRLNQVVLIEPEGISAGRVTAVLTLSSGKIVTLDSDKEFTLLENGQIISNKEHMLSYTVSAGDSIDSGEEELVYDHLDVPRGGEFPLRLGDGTKIWLNSESRLLFPRVWGSKERRVFLEGEAFFEVKKDSLRPFIVVSKGINIRVLGTKFNVMSYDNKVEMFTTLVEGSVLIQNGKEDLGILKPGEQAVFDSLTGVMEVHQVDVALYTSWKDGYYKFEGTPLEEIMNTLARWYNIEIFYNSEELKKIRFSGRIKRYGDIQEFLGVLKGTYDVDFEIKDRTILVVKK